MPVIMEKKQGKDFIRMSKWLTLIVCVFTLSTCKENSINNNNDFFTPVQVYLLINLNLPSYSPLTVPQGFVYETGGNKGIVIYHTIYDEYVAFDRTCPHEPANSCSYISVDSSSTFYRCGQYNPSWIPCCNSKFDPATGNATSGAAKRALRQYNVRRDGDNLIVTNTQ